MTQVGLVTGTSSLPTIENNLNKIILPIDEAGEFKTTIIGFDANTTYYIRAYGINSDGISYGNEVQFTSPEEKVYNGNITLSSQEEVIEFGKNNYTTIFGDVFITNSVTDLTPLRSVVLIHNNLEIKNTTDLRNLEGLNSLKTTNINSAIGILIEHNIALESLSGLNNLEFNRGYFYIIDNDKLVNLEGLNSYWGTSYGGEFRVQNCDNLLNLSGLENLSNVEGNFLLIENLKLNNIFAISNLNYVGDRIVIDDNDSLEDINGFESITSINGVEIYNNNNLTNLDGLSNLNSVKDIIWINNNNSLPNLNGFKNITTIEHIRIENNSSLTNLIGLDNLLKIDSQLYIYNNANMTSLKGLENLTSLERLYVHSNSSLINLEGLSSLSNIVSYNYPISIGYNLSLTSLTGLENLSQVEGNIQIYNNSKLDDFCALKNLLTNGNHDGQISFSENFNNPDTTEIINNCN